MITFILFVLIILCVGGLFMAVVLTVLVGISFLWGYNRQRKKLCQELHAAYQFPWPDDATRCQQSIDSFLCKAKRTIAVPSDSSGCWHTPDSRSSDINFFIRMCHALGCEIVVRRVADHDIEADPDNPQLVQVRNNVETNS